jgi:hypothetical protein
MADNWTSTGVNQDPGQGTNYPFQSPSADVRYLLGDLWLAYDDDTCGYQLPLQVTRLAGFNQSSPARREIKISDAVGTVVFDSTEATYTASLFGTHLEVLQWKLGDAVLRATRHVSPPQYAPTQTYAADFAPVDGTLSARAYMRMPQRVRSIRVGLTKLSGDIVFKEGYNINLTAATPAIVDGGRRQNTITIRGNPGDGIGRLPGCEGVVTAIQRINTISPAASGNFTMDASGCYRIQRPVALTSTEPRKVVLTNAHALQFFNDCQPCCTCNDYVRTYRGLTNVWNQYQAMGAQAEAIRDTFASNVARWNAQRACRIAQPIKLVLNPEARCNLFIGGLYCNMFDCCLRPLVLRTTIEVFPARSGTLNLTCRETVRNGADTQYEDTPYVPSGALPIYDTYFDYADPYGSSKYRMRVRLGDCLPGDSTRVTITAHTPDVVGVDGTQCPLPDPSTVPVPASVLALWADNPPPYPVRAVITKGAPISPTAGCGSCA